MPEKPYSLEVVIPYHEEMTPSHIIFVPGSSFAELRH